MKRLIRLSITLSLAAALVGCGDKKDEGAGEAPQQQAPAQQPPAQQPPAQPGATAASADPAAEAKQMFNTVCATCHGTSGKGDGPAAANLDPKPRDYTDPEWQKSTTDDEIKKIIVGGGPAVGKSNMMPPNPQLANKPEVLDEMVKLIRSFAPQG